MMYFENTLLEKASTRLEITFPPPNKVLWVFLVRLLAGHHGRFLNGFLPPSGIHNRHVRLAFSCRTCPTLQASLSKGDPPYSNYRSFSIQCLLVSCPALKQEPPMAQLPQPAVRLLVACLGRGFPILAVFRLKGQPKRDGSIIVRSCKASQSPVYPIRDAFAVVEHPSCPSSSSLCPLPVG